MARRSAHFCGCLSISNGMEAIRVSFYRTEDRRVRPWIALIRQRLRWPREGTFALRQTCADRPGTAWNFSGRITKTLAEAIFRMRFMLRVFWPKPVMWIRRKLVLQ